VLGAPAGSAHGAIFPKGGCAPGSYGWRGGPRSIVRSDDSRFIRTPAHQSGRARSGNEPRASRTGIAATPVCVINLIDVNLPQLEQLPCGGEKSPLAEPDHLIEVREGCTPWDTTHTGVLHHVSRAASRRQPLALPFNGRPGSRRRYTKARMLLRRTTALRQLPRKRAAEPSLAGMVA
jgi:hypothetical protein